MKSGNFSALPNPVYDPNSTSCGTYAGTPWCYRSTQFTNNTITTGLDPVAQAIQKFFPEPNSVPSGSTATSPSDAINTYQQLQGGGDRTQRLQLVLGQGGLQHFNQPQALRIHSGVSNLGDLQRRCFLPAWI
jgi:hypothetical protein